MINNNHFTGLIKKKGTVYCLSHCFLLSVFLLLTFDLPFAMAQSRADTSESAQISVRRLDDLQAQIDAATVVRDQLKAALRNADSITLTDVQVEIDSINVELKKLRNTFEQTAIGSVNIDILAETKIIFDWKEELSQILQPIVENLKNLTEKPRKVSRLQSIIEHNALKKIAIDAALNAIDVKKTSTKKTTTLSSLSALQSSWKRKSSENIDELVLAQQQLSDLQMSNIPWWQTVGKSLSHFFRGRGLTLLIAAVTAVIVWFSMKGLLTLFQRSSVKMDSHDIRTRRRLVQYAYRFLSFLLIIIAVISVFYTRGDMLLMGLSILAAAGLALGLRQAVPRYFAEGRLLLNIGDIRENERVMYNGLPWQVTSLNVHSVLKNPELTGVMRLPLSDMTSMVSRPAGKEPWFPASLGDFIMLEGKKLMELVRLTPEIVELKDRSGTLISVPAAEFYTSTFKNLTRSETFGISTEFGIDYRHQSISLSEVPEKLKSSIISVLAKVDMTDSLVDTVVELQQAGSSSLDYLIYVRMRPEAAASFLKIERLLQQTCVAVCTEEGWGIPFPHMTIHQLSKT